MGLLCASIRCIFFLLLVWSKEADGLLGVSPAEAPDRELDSCWQLLELLLSLKCHTCRSVLTRSLQLLPRLEFL